MRMMVFTIVLSLLPNFAMSREVDVELVLAVDASRSMSPAELEIQRRGYAEALGSTEVIRAIEGGLLGRIALTYVEWAGDGSQRVIVPWTEIATEQQAQAVAAQIVAFYDDSMRRTSISSALRYAADSIDTNGFDGLRRVIDISGDGPNNMGIPVQAARDEVLSRGITINGLPLMTMDVLSEMWGIPDLDVYYTRCVIGGAGAFVVPVLEWAAFPAAVKRKMVLEIAAIPQQPATAHIRKVQTPAPYDCLVGEKMWKQNRTYWDIP